MFGIFTAVCFAALGACTLTIRDEMFFNPPRVEPAKTAAELALKDEAELTSADSKFADRLGDLLPANVTHGYLDDPDAPITAYSLIEADVDDRSGRPLIVSCYGAGGDRPTHGVYYANKLLPWGDVLEYDYPGYGDSPGAPSFDGIFAQLDAVVAKAESVAGDRPLIYWGHSMGGFICPYMAERSSEADAVVFEGTALSVEEASKDWKPWYMRPLPIRLEPGEEAKGRDNTQPLKDFSGPILVIGGEKDKVLPARQARTLADALIAQGHDTTYLEISGADHINAPLQDEFADRSAGFFAGLRDLDRRRAQRD